LNLSGVRSISSQTNNNAKPLNTLTDCYFYQPDPVREKRASGKSSSADYTQVLTYIKRNTHRQVKKSLFDDPQNRDLSELVEELLAEWLKKNS
jgi:hypothetical protein